VCNLEANPRVRVRSDRKWRAGTAQPVDEDPEARLAKEAQAKSYDARADASSADGSKARGSGDKYVRDTAFLASVLFFVGISGHSPLRQARYGLIGMGTLILIFAVVQLLGLPGSPGGL
jgi:F420H(2)-dependent quinone reductase